MKLITNNIWNAQDWKDYYSQKYPKNKQDHNYHPMIYVIAEEIHENYCKIGIATNMFQRLRALQQGNRRVLFSYSVWGLPEKFIYTAKQVETIAHERFREYNIIAETKQTSGHQEWFNMNPDDALTLINDVLENPKNYYWSEFFKEAA